MGKILRSTTILAGGAGAFTGCGGGDSGLASMPEVGPALEQSTETAVSFSVPDDAYYGPEGSKLTLGSQSVPEKYIGESCNANVSFTNSGGGQGDISYHPNNDLRVSSGGDSITIDNIEGKGRPNPISGSGEVILSDTVSLYLIFGSGEVSSGGFTVNVNCPQPIETTTTSSPVTTSTSIVETTTTTTTTTIPIDSTTSSSSSSVPVESTPTESSTTSSTTTEPGTVATVIDSTTSTTDAPQVSTPKRNNGTTPPTTATRPTGQLPSTCFAYPCGGTADYQAGSPGIPQYSSSHALGALSLG